MTPLSFEWQWNLDYFLFMGLLYLALGAVGCGLLYTLIKTIADISSGEEEEQALQKIAYRADYAKY